MQPNSPNDYKKLLTDVIKKQMVILGPSITLAKARNVNGIVVADDGSVTEITGNPQEVIQSLIDQFVQLSGLIVKKTMEPLLLLNQNGNIGAPAQAPIPTSPTPTPTPNAIEQLAAPVNQATGGTNGS